MSGVPLGADYNEVTDLNPEGHTGGDKGGDRNAVRPLTEAPHPLPHLTVIAMHVQSTHAGEAIHKLGVHPL